MSSHRPMPAPRIVRLAVLALAATFVFVACGDSDTTMTAGDRAASDGDSTRPADTDHEDDTSGHDDGSPVAGACEPNTPDCQDTAEPGHTDGDDEFDADEARAEARAMVGAAEDELDEEVRVARRGAEQYALTEDYVIGRFTVELDADDSGVFRVTSVTVELPDGPETFD